MLLLQLCGLVHSRTRTRALSTSIAVYKKKKFALTDLLITMPKEEVHLADLKVKRMAKRSKRSLAQPARVHWQVLGSGARGGPKSLLLHTDHRRYLFNCGEGTQRLTNQLGISRTLAQLEHVFITSKSWANLGGLPGLCLSVRSCGAPDVTIHGPTGCMELYEATKGFILLFNFDVLRHRLEDGDYSDGAVTVRSVQLQRSKPMTTPAVPTEWEGLTETEREVGVIQYEDSAVAYICSFAPKPGKLDLEACLDRGVKPGPILGQLKAGNDVVLEDGTVVRAQDVVAEAAPPTAYLVLELPDIHYLQALLDSQALQKVENLQTVFHFSPSSVVHNPKYQAWMSALGPSVSHVLLNEDSMGLGLPDVSSYQHKLRTIRGDMFPPLLGAGDHCLEDIDLALSVDRAALSSTLGTGPITQARSGLKVNVRPSSVPAISLTQVLPHHPSRATNELLLGCSKLVDDLAREEYGKGMQEDLTYARTFNPDMEPYQRLKLRLKSIDEVEGVSNVGEDGERVEGKKRKVSLAGKLRDEYGTEVTESLEAKSSFPVITFLGTGSSVPSKYRNVSSILVETERDSWILLDCGEGSLGQLVRLYGWDRAMQVLRGLRAIYISHQHADHHLGMINFILHRETAFQEAGLPMSRLYIIATKRMAEFLTYYHAKLQPILCHAELVQCEHLISYDDLNLPGEKVQLLYNDRMSLLLQDLGLSQFSTCKAIHCPHAFCMLMTTSKGFKLAYSGDTRPNPTFRDLALQDGRGPDLLIHEATMEHFMLYDARIKKHSTFTEAIEEGEGMQAKFTMLTHFSQRYAKMPPLAEIEGKRNVGIAFDNLVVTPELLNLIPSLYPAISRWMWDHCADMVEKGEQYRHKFCEASEEDISVIEMGLVQSPLQEKQLLAEKLEKRYQMKEDMYKRINRKKEMSMARGAKISKVDNRSSTKQ